MFLPVRQQQMTAFKNGKAFRKTLDLSFVCRLMLQCMFQRCIKQNIENIYKKKTLAENLPRDAAAHGLHYLCSRVDLLPLLIKYSENNMRELKYVENR